METPPQVDFQGMEPIPVSKARVLERIAHIEQRYGRITAFRVVVKAPGAHHRTSGHYEVNVRMALPDGREIAVTRTATADERFLDLDFAIDDAFKRARRRLQDQVRRMRGQIKAHVAQPIGQKDFAGSFTCLDRQMKVVCLLIASMRNGSGPLPPNRVDHLRRVWPQLFHVSKQRIIKVNRCRQHLD